MRGKGTIGHRAPGRIAALLGGSLFLTSCGPGFTGPSMSAVGPDTLQEIRMRVTGGIAGVDYTVALDGSTGILRGELCEHGCAFEDGDVLQALHPYQVRYLAVLFLDAGAHQLKGVDFGIQCCDQFHYEVAYRHTGGEGTFQGDSEVLPAEVKTAVAALHGVMSGTLPLIVGLDTQPRLWPQDPFSVEETSVAGDVLRVKVQYGGGCARHEIQGVAWGGWMESFPVQVRVFLTHEGFDDPCDAFITEDRYLDLGPLKRAYRKSYGSQAPGTATLVIRLENHSGDGPALQRTVEYRF